MKRTTRTTVGADGTIRLGQLLDRARAVLFDFDGPICDLFAGQSTLPIASEIKAMAKRKWNSLDHPVEACQDSHAILRFLGDMLDRRRDAALERTVLRTANDIVTRYEYDAMRTAVPEPEIDALLDALIAGGKRLVIVTNNAEGPVRKFLELHEMSHKFEAVWGRVPFEPCRMKPDPSVVLRALEGLGGMSPSDAVMVGDQLTDLTAARSAGVGFLGYTTDRKKARRMRRRGADDVVHSHGQLVTACARPSVNCPRP